jgi:hypothetical protein
LLHPTTKIQQQQQQQQHHPCQLLIIILHHDQLLGDKTEVFVDYIDVGIFSNQYIAYALEGNRIEISFIHHS